METDPKTLLELTADIISAHVSHNVVAVGDLPLAIANVHAALSQLGMPTPAATPEKPKGAVSARSSIKPDHLTSMIDGKPYKTLRRHISLHGYSPETYRETFNLARDYPMVAPSYAARRSELAKKIGLGRKRDTAPEADAPAPAPVAKPAARKPRAPKAANN